MARYYNSYYNNYEDSYPWKNTVSKIYALRRNGDLNQALILARTAHERYPDEDDVAKAYGWTLHSICKQAIENKQPELARGLFENEYMALTFRYSDEFVDNLRRSFLIIAKKLNPFSGEIETAIKESKEGDPKTAAEKMLSLLQQHALKRMHTEDFGWVIYRYINNYDGNQEDYPFFERCLRAYSVVCGRKESLLHSSILNAVLKLSLRINYQFDNFFHNEWGPENLRKDDYQDNNTFEGKTYPSLFYRICNYYVERNLHFDIDSFCERTGKNPVVVANIVRKCWFWKLYHASQNGKGDSLWAMFNEYAESLSSYGASEWHSRVMNLAIRCMTEQDSRRILPFFVSWGHNFLESDWKPSTGKDGKEYGPLAVQVIKAAFDALKGAGERNNEHIDFLISAFSKAVKMVPSNEWQKRNLGRLYYMIGDSANAEAIYQDLSKVLYDKYYYWQEYAQLVENPSVKAGMLAKAILLESNEDYIGDIRLDFASYLIAAGNKKAASIELERYHSNRVKKGWKIPDKYSDLKRGIDDTPACKGNNQDLYQSMAIVADEFVYKNLPWVEMVLVESWKNDYDKSFVVLTDGKGHNIKVNRNSQKLLNHAHLGQSFWVKYAVESNKLLLIKPSSSEDWAVIPEICAIVKHVNTEKNVAHAITSDNKAVFFGYNPSASVAKNSFVTVRCFERQNEDKTTSNKVVSWKSCEKEDALSSFRNKVVVVDDVNPSKQLFHFVLGRGLIGGIVRYADTDLRPEIGDFIKVHYCITKDRFEKKIAMVINVDPTDEEAEGMVFTTIGFVDVKCDKHGHQYGFINNYYVPEALTYDPVCRGKVEAKVLNIQTGKERVFEIKAIE